MSKNLFLTLIVFACLIVDVLNQRFNRQQGKQKINKKNNKKPHF